MKINRQRALVREFFHSARSLLQHYNSLDAQRQQQQQQHDSLTASDHTTSDSPNSSSSASDVLIDQQPSATVAVQQTESHTEPRQIIVTLAKGQGGTAADGEFRRKIGNSWQVYQTEHSN
jgi:hypothetical protein